MDNIQKVNYCTRFFMLVVIIIIIIIIMCKG
jgi:hypothetical protein